MDHSREYNIPSLRYRHNDDDEITAINVANNYEASTTPTTAATTRLEEAQRGISSQHHHDSHDDENRTTTAHDATKAAAAAGSEGFFLDNIIVGYAFGKKKMETMGLIMAEASKALSTFECSGTLSSALGRRMPQQQQQQQQKHQQQQQQNPNYAVEHMLEESSMATRVAATSMATAANQVIAGGSGEDITKEPMSAVGGAANYFSDHDEDARSFCSTYTRASFISGRSSQHRGGNANNGLNGIQLTFMPDSSGMIHLVRTSSCEGESVTGSSVATTAATLPSLRKLGTSSTGSCSSVPQSSSSSLSKERNDAPFHPGSNSASPGKSLANMAGGGQQKCCPSHTSFSRRSNCSSRSASTSRGCSPVRNRHPIRVSFVPVDLDTPLEEQHGGKFDVILHKMTEDILCMSKMLRSRSPSEEDATKTITTAAEDAQRTSEDLFESNPGMTRHQARASRRLRRLRQYKRSARPSCVLVDSPEDILAVMSRADMAAVLSRCLAGVTTKGGIGVRTPRFRVVEEVGGGGDELIATDGGMDAATSALANDIDASGFAYPLIAKPLTAAGTKFSHHMGIVLARDGLARLRAPCLLQEYANHGGELFKVYVLGGSVWVFSRESLPNLPLGENGTRRGEGEINGYNDSVVAEGLESTVTKQEEGGSKGTPSPMWRPKKRPRAESYVEFERPAGSRCYVEFNSQRPYPKLSDFGIVASRKASQKFSTDDCSIVPEDGAMAEQCRTPRIEKKGRHEEVRPSNVAGSVRKEEDGRQSTSPGQTATDLGDGQTAGTASSDLARHVTAEELEPVTAVLREAFGLELFGFDVLVKHDNVYSGPGTGGGGSADRDDEGKEILVVDVNYFPGYKEVPNFPSLLAQYLTQKAVESRLRNSFDGS